METPSSSTDVPFTLNSVTLTDDYTGDFKSTNRTIIYTLDFSIPVKFFTAPDVSGIIRDATALVSTTDDPARPITKVAVVATLAATAENPESTTTIDDSFGF
jgi:selenophosphate synthase